MARPCQVEASPLRREVDAALLSGRTLTSVHREFGSTYGESYASLKRHARYHLARPGKPRQADAPPEPPSTPTSIGAVDPLARLTAQLGQLDGLASGDLSPNQALGIYEERRRTLAEISRLQPKPPPTASDVRLSEIAGYQELEALVFDTLLAFPDARKALADAFSRASALDKEKTDE
jgi:hypothetical protein